jgi:hypothetical protein
MSKANDQAELWEVESRELLIAAELLNGHAWQGSGGVYAGRNVCC